MKQKLGIRPLQKGVSLKSMSEDRLRSLGLALTTILWFLTGTPSMALEETTVRGRLDSGSNVLEDKGYSNVESGNYILSWRETLAPGGLQAEAEQLLQLGKKQYQTSRFREALLIVSRRRPC
jgi:hypothetical protein